MAVFTTEQKADHDTDVTSATAALDTGDTAAASLALSEAMTRLESAGVSDNMGKAVEVRRLMQKLLQ